MPAAGSVLRLAARGLVTDAPSASLGVCGRLFSSAASGEAVVLGGSGNQPVLLQLPERKWGALAQLPASVVSSLLGSKQPGTVGVLRSPLASFDEPLGSISKVVRVLGDNTVAVAAEVANTPHARVVVDEYTRDSSGAYQLRTVATDLLRYLRAKNTRVAVLPDLSALSSSSGLSAAAGATAVGAASRGVRQSTNEVLMVAPTAFGFNEQAAQDNSFMHAAQKPGEGSALTRQVLKEYAALHHQLTEVAGVKVHLFEHGLQHGTPDACFPNNWFSTHPGSESGGGVGKDTLVLYPMKHPNRAAERRPEIIKVLQQRGYQSVYDMSVEEKNNRYFEGTGVLVIDRVNGVAYVDISERADATLAQQWADRMGYKDLVTFRSVDLRGKPVYHTNVMMAIGTSVAIVCGESVPDDKERARLMGALRKTHEVVDISLKQMDSLCGNALELEDGRGLPVMAMSTQAYNAFTADQRKAILRHTAGIVHAPIDTLEKVGGGGVRCTLAELF